MSARQSLRTLAVMGLGAIAGGAVVAAWGARREAGAALAREAEGRILSAEQEAQAAPIRGWTKGKGWGWIWGKDDEVGALNALTNQSRAAGALPGENR